MRIAMMLSISDFPGRWGKSERTWGEAGVRSLIDSVHECGIRLLNWRITCSGSLNYPSKVPFGDAYVSPQPDEAHGVDFRSWDPLRAAVDYAHAKDMTIWAWYDQTDSHGGCGGHSIHGQFILAHPHTIRRTERGGGYNPVEVEEHRRPDCPLRGMGTQGSLSYPEVQEFRLSVIREVVAHGVDGVYLVDAGYIGYEPPVVASFREKTGLDANELDEEDPRWRRHQGQILLDYLRRVREVVGPQRTVILESRGRSKREPGLHGYLKPYVAQVFQEGLLDYASVWVAEDIAAARDIAGDACHLARRFEVHSPPDIEGLFAGAEEMAAHDVPLFFVDEATNIEPDHWGGIKRLVARFPDTA